MDMTRPAPSCPECGGERFWYGSVEFWVRPEVKSFRRAVRKQNKQQPGDA
ncbi:MAG TPA: hypothetical protein VGG83_15760 [Trebonia sp.]|jgi:hypothetical protein